MSEISDAFDLIAHAPRKLMEAGQDAYDVTQEFLEDTGIRGTINHAVSDLDDAMGGVIGETVADIQDYSAEGME
jgi:hypothetical protein